MDQPIRLKTPQELAAMELCPTCEGGGVVVDLRFGRERRLVCRTCQGHGLIDAGVWPYDSAPAAARS